MTAEDVGTTVADMSAAARATRFVAGLLHKAGASLVVSAPDHDRTLGARAQFNAKIAHVNTIHPVSGDVYSPKVLGAVLNAKTIPQLGAAIVCGTTNNQLATAADGNLLMQRNVAYARDYVADAGGSINVVAGYLGESIDSVERQMAKIPGRVNEIIAKAKAQRRPANEVADQFARDLLARSRRPAPV